MDKKRVQGIMPYSPDIPTHFSMFFRETYINSITNPIIYIHMATLKLLKKK